MIKLHVPKSIRQHYTDFYLTMYIKRGQPDSNYSVAINGYVNHRLYNQSTYVQASIHNCIARNLMRMVILVTFSLHLLVHLI